MCAVCRQPAHGRGSSGAAVCPGDPDQRLTDSLAAEEGWQRCHKCSALVEHREACQHMTCRCGAQFCYVCGARWRTCDCTLEQLGRIKQRAAARRELRAFREEIETTELREALELISKMEEEHAWMGEERQREELRRIEAEEAEEAAEAERRERVRRATVARKYQELRDALARLNGLQRTALRQTHETELEAATAEAAGERTLLHKKQNAEHHEERRLVEAARADQELDWDREYRIRAAWEERLEKEYEAMLDQFWAGKPGGYEQTRALVQAYRKKNDERMNAWKKWKDEKLERFTLKEEQKITAQEGAREHAREKLEEAHVARDLELMLKQKADLRWLRLVMNERDRLLEDAEVYETENGETAENTEQLSIEKLIF